ncbi:hypothetical protein DFS33DRAFT_152985 [Desarmillaria ectypa]|nr:hypothetical protein DFS33DRAFT_152985 [Desarmillaria ectypa]
MDGPFMHDRYSSKQAYTSCVPSVLFAFLLSRLPYYISTPLIVFATLFSLTSSGIMTLNEYFRSTGLSRVSGLSENNFIKVFRFVVAIHPAPVVLVLIALSQGSITPLNQAFASLRTCKRTKDDSMSRKEFVGYMTSMICCLHCHPPPPILICGGQMSAIFRSDIGDRRSSESLSHA